MLKFKYNYLNNTLSIHKEADTWNQIPEEEQFQGHFNSSGFKLDNGWITFTLYENKIKIFAKLEQEGFWGQTYFRKYLPKQNEIIFIFTEQDEVEKINGKWGKKYA